MRSLTITRSFDACSLAKFLLLERSRRIRASCIQEFDAASDRFVQLILACGLLFLNVPAHQLTGQNLELMLWCISRVLFVFLDSYFTNWR